MAYDTDNLTFVDKEIDYVNLNRAKVNIINLIKKCVDRYNGLSLNDKPRIGVVIQGGLPKIAVDEKEMKLVFMVIFAEMLKLHENEMMTLTISDKKNYIEINISNHTVISDLRSLFDVDSDAIRLCTHITWAHGGTISIDSARGITLYLPIDPKSP